MNTDKIYDISQALSPKEGSNKFELEIIPIKIGNHDFCGSHFCMNAHFGTHIDAPCHMQPNVKTTEEYGTSRFILPAVVVEIQDETAITPAELEGIDIKEGQAVLFKTNNSRAGVAGSAHYEGPIVYCSPKAMDVLVQKKISMVGFDASHGERDAAPGEVQEAPIHTACFANDITVLECIDLKDIAPGNYTLIVLPLKIMGTNGAPARAILLGA